MRLAGARRRKVDEGERSDDGAGERKQADHVTPADLPTREQRCRHGEGGQPTEDSPDVSSEHRRTIEDQNESEEREHHDDAAPARHHVHG